ncbi:MAG: SURF1 family protein [Candidatus Eisenbacteria bacterium]|nr:SURF1 family protein [Candidatus Eisenbacteria bacterium]
MRLPRRVMVVLLLAAAAGCLRLCLWQVDRLGQRRERNARIAADLRRAPALLTAADARNLALLEGRRVAARGVFRPAGEQWHNTSVEGVPGALVVTPLSLGEGTEAPVARGWVPAPGGPPKPGAYPADTGRVTVTGRVTRVAPLSFALQVEPGAPSPAAVLPPGSPGTGRGSASGPGAGPRVALRPLPPPRLDDGPHLGYAVQWAVFAAMFAVAAAYFARGPRA